eukprot:1159469-Pelagomonas_calceolata.AAC.1
MERKCRTGHVRQCWAVSPLTYFKLMYGRQNNLCALQPCIHRLPFASLRVSILLSNATQNPAHNRPCTSLAAPLGMELKHRNDTEGSNHAHNRPNNRVALLRLPGVWEELAATIHAPS